MTYRKRSVLVRSRRTYITVFSVLRCRGPGIVSLRHLPYQRFDWIDAITNPPGTWRLILSMSIGTCQMYTGRADRLTNSFYYRETWSELLGNLTSYWWARSRMRPELVYDARTVHQSGQCISCRVVNLVSYARKALLVSICR